MAAPSSRKRAQPPARQTLAADIVKHHFGRAPNGLERLDGGLTNEVYACVVGKHHCILRLNTDATKIQNFLKEQWAMERAREAGVPTPRVLEVGNVAEGSAFMMVERISGTPAIDFPDRLGVLRQLGKLMALCHGVRTTGFGPVFDWSANLLSQRRTWAAFLDLELGAKDRLKLLRRHDMVTDRCLKETKAALADMHRWRKASTLHHGDLRLKNVLVDPPSGRIVAVLDWEDAVAAPAPYWDLSIALHDLGIDEAEALLEGYGLSPRQFEPTVMHLRALNLLNYLPAVEAAVAAKDRKRLAWLRLRLRGGFALFG